MKALKQVLVVLILVLVIHGAPLRAQTHDQDGQQESKAVSQVLNRIIAQEHQLIQRFRKFSPRVETYIQAFRQGKRGPKVVGDDYFLGRLVVKNGIVEHSFVHHPPRVKRLLGDMVLIGPIARLFTFQFEPNVFAYPVFVDATRFDRQHYQFEFVRREFLGDVRCLVFNVRPRPTGGRGLFEGRIWVEDQNYHIVRFNGSYGSHSNFRFHFDSWRENVQPGLWVPVYIYSEESSLAAAGNSKLGFRSQTRLWGYTLKATTPNEELTQILVDSKAPVRDSSDTDTDMSPVASERAWMHEAAENILERLEKAGLLAPPSPVDKVLDTVVNNLIITNHLNNLPPIHCRVLLTYPLESTSVGDTIIVSKGLIDVLPDEASLAMILAHELAHIVLGHNVDTKYAFYDRMMVPDEDILSEIDLQRSEKEEEAADAKALQLLKNSPYADKLGNAGLFLRALSVAARHEPHLLGAHLGNQLIEHHHRLLMAKLMAKAPKLQRNNLDQIAALPLGARIKVNAWNDQVSLMKAKPVALISAREKMPFEITPLMPYLTRYKASGQGQEQQAGQ